MKHLKHAAYLLLVLALLILFFSFLQTPEGIPVRHYFLTAANFKFIATQAVIIAVGALGMTIVVASGGIDLSAGAVLTLAHVVTASLLQENYSAFTALLTALSIGVLIGVLNGGLTSLLRLSPIIVTLGMAGVAGGLAQWAGRQEAFSIPSSWLLGVMAPFPSWIALAPGVWLTLLLAVGLGLLCRNTAFGRHLFAVGSSEETAAHCGVRVSLIRTLVYALAGAFFGFAGLLQTARLQDVGPSIFGWTLDILAAVAIGGTRFGGGRGSVLGSLFGALAIAILRNGSQQAGWHPAAQSIAVGVVLVIAVALRRGPRKIVQAHS